MEELLYNAKLAEKAERYNEMTEWMKQVAELHTISEMTPDEYNLLSVAYKCCLAEKRLSWRLLNQIAIQETGKNGHLNQPAAITHPTLECIVKYMQVVGTEIINKCEELIEISKKQSAYCKDAQSRTFFFKLTADYMRYIAEISSSSRQPEAMAESLQLYEQALTTGLPNSHYLCISTTLNKAILFYELLNKKQDAIRLLEEAIQLCPEFQTTNDHSRDSTVMMCLLQNNLKMWKADINENNVNSNLLKT